MNCKDNLQNLQTLSRLVTSLTTSGKSELDQQQLKQLKKLCKNSDVYVKETFLLSFKMMKKKHAEIRLGAFLIFNELFLRSHVFRELVIDKFKIICDLVLGINKYKPLPKPDSVAKRLKQKAIECIQNWYDKFKDGYTLLRLGYNYLKEYHKLDFDELTARTEAERMRDEEERIRQEDNKRRKISKISDELNEMNGDIENLITQFNNTFNLLIPSLKDFFIALPDDDSNIQSENNFNTQTEVPLDDSLHYGSDFMRSHGIIKGTSVQINLDDVHKVYETEDNEVIVTSLKEQINTLITIFIPKVKKWEQGILPYSSDNQDLLRQIIDLKRKLESSIKKYSSISIISMPKSTNNKKTGSFKNSIDNLDSSDDDDDDFVEVPLDDPRVIEAMKSEAELLGYANKSSDELISKIDFNSSDAGPSGFHQTKISKTGSILKKLCPDSYLNDTNMKPPVRYENSLAGLSQVWNANSVLHENDDGPKNSSGIMGIDTCPINYERDFEPVKWECRAPMKSGRLCPRKDREKCPLHGPIIARDEAGIPIHLKDAEKEAALQEKYERDNPDWQDPALLAEIRAATGVDLDMKKAKKRKRKYPNLTDLKAINKTPRARLSRKIFNKKALSRVRKALSKCEK